MVAIPNNLPLLEIVFFIAQLFAPVNATHIQVDTSQGPQPLVVWQKVPSGWYVLADHSVWSVEGEAVKVKPAYSDAVSYPKAYIPELAAKKLQPGESMTWNGIKVEYMGPDVLVNAYKDGKPVAFSIKYKTGG